jgi:hypothetical protein
MDSLKFALRRNAARIKREALKTPQRPLREGPAGPVPLADSPQKEMNKKIWKSHNRTYLDRPCRECIAAVRDVFLHSKKYKWQSPIGHLIPREEDLESWGDSSLRAGGGVNLTLRFIAFLPYPKELFERTIAGEAYQTGRLKKEDLVTINDLEFLIMIIMYCGALLRLRELRKGDGTPLRAQLILKNWVDNTVAESWTRKACRTSAASKALSKILCGCMMSGELGLNADYIEGEKNTLADRISRLLDKNAFPNFALLFKEFPQLKCCLLFVPGPELLSALYSALLQRKAPAPTSIKITGHFVPVETSSLPGAPGTT